MNNSACGKMIYQAGINRGIQFANISESPTNELIAGFMNERLHLGVPVYLVRPFDENEPGLPLDGGTIKLSFRRRQPFAILESVIVAKQSKV